MARLTALKKPSIVIDFAVYFPRSYRNPIGVLFRETANIEELSWEKPGPGFSHESLHSSTTIDQNTSVKQTEDKHYVHALVPVHVVALPTEFRLINQTVRKIDAHRALFRPGQVVGFQRYRSCLESMCGGSSASTRPDTVSKS